MRECDQCNLCCKYFHINDPGFVVKPNNDLCQHWKNGCQIYDNRGYVCKSYKCLWLKEYLPEWMKPDKIKILFDRFWLDNDHIYMIGHVDSITNEVEKVISQVCNSGISVMIPQSKGIFKKILYESMVKPLAGQANEEDMINYAKHSNLLVDRFMAYIQ